MKEELRYEIRQVANGFMVRKDYPDFQTGTAPASMDIYVFNKFEDMAAFLGDGFEENAK